MSAKNDRLKAQEAYTTIPNDRPNEPPTPVVQRECPTSRHGQHDFSMRLPSPVGSDIKLFGCWQCSAMSPRSQARLAAWYAQKK